MTEKLKFGELIELVEIYKRGELDSFKEYWKRYEKELYRFHELRNYLLNTYYPELKDEYTSPYKEKAKTIDRTKVNAIEFKKQVFGYAFPSREKMVNDPKYLEFIELSNIYSCPLSNSFTKTFYKRYQYWFKDDKESGKFYIEKLLANIKKVQIVTLAEEANKIGAIEVEKIINDMEKQEIKKINNLKWSKEAKEKLIKRYQLDRIKLRMGYVFYKIRKENNLSIKDVAKLLDSNKETIEALESGKNFSVSLFEKYCLKFNKKEEELLNISSLKDYYYQIKESEKKHHEMMNQLQEFRNNEKFKNSNVLFADGSIVILGKNKSAEIKPDGKVVIAESRTLSEEELDEKMLKTSLTKKKDSKYLGERIRNLRIKNNLSQDQLAEKLNVSVRIIYDYESGLKRPGLDTLIQLAKLFNILVDDLLME